jgi:hypothetical protein
LAPCTIAGVVLNVLRWVLAASVLLALLAALVRGWWRRVPVFCCYLAAQLPLLVGYRPESEQWLQRFWVPLEPLVVLLRMGATVEAFWHNSTERRFLVGMSLSLLAAALVTLVWRVLPPEADWRIIEVRRYAQIWCAAFLLLYAVLMFVIGDLRRGWRLTHLLVLLGILLNHAAVSVASLRGAWGAGWWIVSPISFGAAAVGYLAWMILCPLRDRQRGPQARSAAG